VCSVLLCNIAHGQAYGGYARGGWGSGIYSNQRPSRITAQQYYALTRQRSAYDRWRDRYRMPGLDPIYNKGYRRGRSYNQKLWDLEWATNRAIERQRAFRLEQIYWNRQRLTDEQERFFNQFFSN